MTANEVRSAPPIGSYFEFPAILGTQAGRHQYAAIWSLGMLRRITDEPLARALVSERTDTHFIQSLAASVSDTAGYTLAPAFVLGVLGQIEFAAAKDSASLGMVRMDATSRVEILDGVHRLAALQHAPLAAPQTSALSFPVVIIPLRDATEIPHRRLELRSRHRPARKHEIRENLYREIAKDSISSCEFLRRAIDIEGKTISMRSKHVFTLRTYARACWPLIAEAADLSPRDATPRLADYWETLAAVIRPWHQFAHGEIKAGELRSGSILGWSSTLGGLAILGARLMHDNPSDWKRDLDPLATLDWRREADLWQAVPRDKVKASQASQATEGIYHILHAACASAEERRGHIQPTPSISALRASRQRKS